MRFPRLLIAAALGGIYSVISLFIDIFAPIALATDAFVCLLMCAIVFAEQGRRLSSTLLCSFLFVGISMMTGGCMTAIFNFLNRLDLPLDNIEADGISAYLFAVIAAIAGMISLKNGELISHRASIKRCILTVTMNGKVAKFYALSDSGNLVKDPISGKAVIIVDETTLSNTIDFSAFKRYEKGEYTNSPLAFLLIPINTAAGRSILVAAHPDKLEIEFSDKSGKPRKAEIDALIAPSDIRRSAEGYSAIIPSGILKI